MVLASNAEIPYATDAGRAKAATVRLLATVMTCGVGIAWGRPA